MRRISFALSLVVGAPSRVASTSEVRHARHILFRLLHSSSLVLFQVIYGHIRKSGLTSASGRAATKASLANMIASEC